MACGPGEFHPFEPDDGPYPLKSASDVCDAFYNEMKRSNEPDLLYVSILLGMVEERLSGKVTFEGNSLVESPVPELSAIMFEPIELLEVKKIYVKFRNRVEEMAGVPNPTPRDVIRIASQLIWGTMPTAFKDRPFSHTMFSYLERKSCCLVVDIDSCCFTSDPED